MFSLNKILKAVLNTMKWISDIIESNRHKSTNLI